MIKILGFLLMVNKREMIFHNSRSSTFTNYSTLISDGSEQSFYHFPFKFKIWFNLTYYNLTSPLKLFIKYLRNKMRKCDLRLAKKHVKIFS